jgi:hypothetical protein
MIRVVLVDDEPQSCKSLAIKLKAVAEDIEISVLFTHPEEPYRYPENETHGGFP